jgi:hypothetical protein
MEKLNEKQEENSREAANEAVNELMREISNNRMEAKLMEMKYEIEMEKRKFIAEVTAQKHIIIPDAISKLLEIEEGQIVEVSIMQLKK